MNETGDYRYVVTTTEVVMREQEVWAPSLSQAAEYVEEFKIGDGDIIDRQINVLSVEADFRLGVAG